MNTTKSFGGFLLVSVLIIFSWPNPGAHQSLVFSPDENSVNNEEWTAVFGGTFSDAGYSVVQTSDDGYVVVGETQKSENQKGDIWLIKTDLYGQELWNKIYGGLGWETERQIQKTLDGGFIIIGDTTSFSANGTEDIWLLKIDGSGEEEWNVTFGGDQGDTGYGVQQTWDKGFILVGQTWSFSKTHDLADVWLIKTDELGNELWNKTYGGEDGDGGFAVVQTDDGGYAVAGDTLSYGDGWADIWLIKTDAFGHEQWNTTYAFSENEVAWSLQQTQDSGFVLTGFTGESTDIYGDILLMKTNDLGDLLWMKTYGGPAGETAYSVEQTLNGGYILTGTTYSFASGRSDRDLWLLKTDGLGNLIWDKTFGGIYPDTGYGVRQTTDEGYIVVGDTYSFGAGMNDVFLVKVAEPTLSLTFDGGFGLSVLISNNADETENHLVWSCVVSKGFIFGPHIGSIEELPSKDHVNVHIPLIGLGKSTIRFTVNDLSKTVTCFILGPLVSIK
jgi:hypothetical protein